jgi:hypothetical protein
MNKYLIFLFVSLFALNSCVKNNDEPDTPPPPSVVLTPQNIAGTWEIYYFYRSVNERFPLREANIDGTRMTYNTDGTFYEISFDGVTRDEGTYTIIGNDSIEFIYRVKQGKRLKAGEEERQIHIVDLTDKKMVRSHLYKASVGGTTHWMEEVFMSRNINKISSANETPDLSSLYTKEIIDRNRLMGTWKITKVMFRKYYAGQVKETTNPKDDNDRTLKFFTDSGIDKFEARGADGNLLDAGAGTFRIVDDVVHLFSTNSKGEAEAFVVWLKNWSNSTGVDTVEDYVISRQDNTDPFYYEDVTTYYQKVD